jgi:hypothetical protein
MTPSAILTHAAEIIEREAKTLFASYSIGGKLVGQSKTEHADMVKTAELLREMAEVA